MRDFTESTRSLEQAIRRSLSMALSFGPELSEFRIAVEPTYSGSIAYALKSIGYLVRLDNEPGMMLVKGPFERAPMLSA